ncbi:M20/M25/M40 family metallo-hydrolase [Glycomyces harbinensis]|uniref:Acetylornithine deacetylase/Succinyl-diaminopimelate desuccinylase n=1 Tax=Glycomyces harbinensis TaxID=58114 RepID=A0A1G7AFY3_9ACTN|nr:M20/M25/M40 family metallo-hydrolase [Glycomyces harbinensis]SDE13613.1 Acetylornithine deacetylase/Succinyl-diaminopimelate desuccinylase [Glycomyces harbinensis]
MVDAQALDEVVTFTSELIRIDTTNRGGGDGNEREAAEYAVGKLFDAGIEGAIVEKAPLRSNVIARIEGSEPDAPALLVHGHLDVVPAEAADWSVHPFSGEITDDGNGGMLWGRGALDMKSMDAMVLATVRSWAREGVKPRRPIVIAFTADEEASAEYGAGYLAESHADAFAGCTEGVSESGGFTFHGGNDLRIYPIAAGERGTAWLKLSARGRAGHGSKANPDNAVSKLAAAIARIGAHEWPVRLTPTVRAALTELGALYGAEPDFAHVDDLIGKLGPAAQLVESTLRNSANPTVLHAGYKVNVIPEHANAEVDGRMLPGFEDEFAATMDELCGPDVHWEFQHRTSGLGAPVDTPTFAAMREAIRKFDPDGHPVPFCMSGGTDAKQFSELGITGYGFSPLGLPPEFGYGRLAHGVDERVPVEGLRFGLRVLDDFLRHA